mmetsp:Transcript_11507/g.49586  ORF Transcript_11507/g.49586 Transcript_11507/m.49586 type:complete len:245 (+) Transcript_11507:1559-2293(+)
MEPPTPRAAATARAGATLTRSPIPPPLLPSPMTATMPWPAAVTPCSTSWRPSRRSRNSSGVCSSSASPSISSPPPTLAPTSTTSSLPTAWPTPPSARRSSGAGPMALSPSHSFAAGTSPARTPSAPSKLFLSSRVCPSLWPSASCAPQSGVLSRLTAATLTSATPTCSPPAPSTSSTCTGPVPPTGPPPLATLSPSVSPTTRSPYSRHLSASSRLARAFSVGVVSSRCSTVSSTSRSSSSGSSS